MASAPRPFPFRGGGVPGGAARPSLRRLRLRHLLAQPVGVLAEDPEVRIAARLSQLGRLRIARERLVGLPRLLERLAEAVVDVRRVGKVATL